jgi:ATP-dependent RNA helicase DHX29
VFLCAGRRKRRNPELSRQLLEEQGAKEASNSAYQAMQVQRAALPTAAHKQQVLEAIAGSQVLVLTGATGCGKSTQGAASGEVVLHIPAGPCQ